MVVALAGVIEEIDIVFDLGTLKGIRLIPEYWENTRCDNVTCLWYIKGTVLSQGFFYMLLMGAK